jgi:hypothetical protein
MRIDRSFLGWGIFFIVAGAIPLAAQAGAIAPGTVDRWWSVWPLILVGIGIGLILRGTPLEAVGGLIVAATFGLMVGGAAAAGGFADIGAVCGPDESGTPFSTESGTIESLNEVDLELDCGRLHVGMVGGSGWSVAGTSEDGSGPRIDLGPSSVDIRPEDGGSAFFNKRVDWDVRLPTDARLDLDIEMNAGTMTTELAGANLGLVKLDLNAGSATLDLGDVRAIDGFELGVNAGSLTVDLPQVSMTGSIEANAGSVTLCTPPDVALRLHTGDSVLSSQDFGDAGLIQNGDTWETPGYDTAATRIELRTEANAGSFELDPVEGCS